jgi:hypothetical protein
LELENYYYFQRLQKTVDHVEKFRRAPAKECIQQRVCGSRRQRISVVGELLNLDDDESSGFGFLGVDGRTSRLATKKKKRFRMIIRNENKAVASLAKSLPECW